ncbi:MAG: sulfatase-like hydrolase/transferase [Bacilli bacterium]|nr:sulfatase-like hydrolase/transferase [Bacilli bacterium]
MLKKLIPAYILSFVIAFTIFINEPIILYATNKNDLWFDFMTMLKPATILFISSFILVSIIYTLIKYLSKKDKAYNIILVISFIIYFASYIQGNYLLKDLPGLEGTTIVWKGFLVQNIITLFIWLILITTYIILVKKFSFEKVIKTSSKVAIVIFIMLLVSCTSTMLTTKKMFRKKYPLLVTDINYTDFSKDKNFIIFLVDAVDSSTFYKELENSKYKDSYKDFTYYPDTTSYYLFTRDSIPLILSGIPNHNEKDYYEYYNEAFDKSELFDNLINNNYDINIYDHELIWTTEKGKNVKNTTAVSNDVKVLNFARHNLKYVGYKYLPYCFKKYAKIENMDFNNSKDIDYTNSYSWDDIDNYKLIVNSNVTINENKQFKFIHVNGSHPPYNIDEELNRVEETKDGYNKEVSASIKLMSSYIEMLKQNGVYDNSVIILLADHGYTGSKNTLNKVNPILLVKGLNEINKKMIISDKKVSFLDLKEAYKELLNGKKSTDLFKDIAPDRIRTFIWYKFTKERKMVEYKLDGHAWNGEKAKKTGRKFNR